MRHEVCNRCKFWSGQGENPHEGICHHYPPIAAGNAMMKQVTIGNPNGVVAPVPIFCLPSTAAEHWCGEFIPGVVS